MKVVARIRYPQAPGGFHNTFAYKHSDGRVLYFATVQESKAVIYDLGKVVSGTDSSTWLVGAVPEPDAVEADHGRRVSRLLCRLRPGHAPGQVLRRGARRVLGVGRHRTRNAEAAVHDHRLWARMWRTRSRRRPMDSTR